MRLQLAAHFRRGILLARVVERDLQVGIFHQLRRLHNGLHRKNLDGAALFVEHAAQVLLRLQVFARGHRHGIFHRAHYNGGINALLFAQPFDLLIKQTSHKIQFRVSKISFEFLVSCF